MERGIYFDGWYRNNHCYHPSLPLRSMQMIEDIEACRGTILVWSAMGGGSISLPYLYHEAFGEVDARLRFYGFMNDAEFIAACEKRGIKVFGIVFEVQGWEFPARFDEQGKLLALNVKRDEDMNGWYGLREFSSGAYDDLFEKKLKDFYPDGIVNSDGETVTDLWQECAARTYKGEPVHAQWVEVVGHSPTCHQTCRNNPVWREYLKKIMALQIDAGVQGIQLDECELPITALGAGGCFCKDCMKQFREYLKHEKAAGRLDPAYDDLDLDTFDYKQFINDNHIEFPNGAPLFKEYWHFQLRAVKKYFSELADFGREYALKTRGKPVQISGNFFNLMPVYLPIRDKADVIITEMKSTLLRQPYWYRYCAGFGGDKPVIVAENPYGGMIPDLLEKLNRGKAGEVYQLFLLEASVYGVNMSVPYGGWMGNEIKDSFYPPMDKTRQVQDFLASHEDLFPKGKTASVAVVYSWKNNYWRETVNGYSGEIEGGGNSMLFYNPKDLNDPAAPRHPFWEAVKALSDRQVSYDVLVWGDGDVCEDGGAPLDGYDLVVLPNCAELTDQQRQTLAAYKGAVVAFADDGDKKNVAIEKFLKRFDAAFAPMRDAWVDDSDLGVQHVKTDAVEAVHLLNYAYDEAADAVLPAKNVTLRVRTAAAKATMLTFAGESALPVIRERDILVVKLPPVPVYAAIVLN